MKKAIIIILCLFILVGCGKKTTEEDLINIVDENFELEKVNEDKDWVYLTEYKTLKLVEKDYELDLLTINVNSEDVENVNLELKRFVINSYNEYEIYDNLLVQGNVITYKYYVTDNYISVIQNYYMTVDTMVGDKKENLYVIDLSTGKTISNEELLSKFNLTIDDIYNTIEKEESEDKNYELSSIKENGYKLYVNDDNKLCVIFDVITDNETIKKDLVIQN